MAPHTARLCAVNKALMVAIIGALSAGVIGAGAYAFWPTDAVWPEPGAQLTQPAGSLENSGEPLRVYLDAGHGAAGNTGNLGALGQHEQDFTLSLANDLHEQLEALDGFEARVCRQEDEVVPYALRIEEAESWGAHVYISLHSDVRTPIGVGYSVLWSDEGEEDLVSKRLSFARTMAGELGALGLPAYDGSEYVGLYAGDEVPGVFVDRHEPDKRIFVLRKPRMPSIIVETHNAKNAQEAERWNEPAVRRAFGAAVALAVSKL